MVNFPTGGELVDDGVGGGFGLAGVKGVADGVATGTDATPGFATGRGAPKTLVEAYPVEAGGGVGGGA